MANGGRRPVLRQGSRGGTVKELQMLLNAHLRLHKPLKIDGDFGMLTVKTVKQFQVQKHLFPDGIVGPKTWSALSSHAQRRNLYLYRPGPQELLADIARPFIGATEAWGNRMGNDPRMRQIFEADRLAPGGQTDGYPWCCAFVSLCVQRLLSQSLFFGHVRPPVTASVSNFRTRWAPSQQCLIFRPTDTTYSPHKGDIVVFTFSHIGIVETAGNNQVGTIEGNTNEEGSREGTTCRRKTRPFSLIRCFIRLPVPASYDFDNQICRAV